MDRVWIVGVLVVVACDFHPNDGSTTDGAAASDAKHAGDDAQDDAMTIVTDPGARRKPITIQGARVMGSQTDFPVWIDLTDADIAARAQATGSDIFFTGSDGTALDYQLEAWSSSTHRLLAWVRLPKLTATNTTIYVDYGDVAKAVEPNAPGVFRANFAAVWHLDDALSSSAIADATGATPGTATLLTPADQVAGQLGGGIAFDGTGNAMIAFTTSMLAGNTAATISAWVSQPATTHTSAAVVVGAPATDESRFLYSYAGNGHGSGVGVGQYSDDWYPAGEDIEAEGWTMLVWTSEGPNKKNHVFRNGVEIAGSPYMVNAAASTTGSSGYLGYAPSLYGPSNGMLGTLDEVRLATVQRDPTWIATEYANQSSPATFYTVGAEQIPP